MSTVAKKIMMGSGAVAEPFEIEQSLIFEDGSSAYLTRTPSSASNRKTWTWSSWVKRGNFASSSVMGFFSACDGSAGNTTWIGFSSDSLAAIAEDGDTSLVTTAGFRDLSAWYHIVFVYDSTQGTAANRQKIYVNGVQETSFSTANYPDQNLDSFINNDVQHTIGSRVRPSGSPVTFFDGYLAETHFIDGTALTPSSFGETNSATGQWIPKEYTGGSYGTNGFYLKFVSGAIGTDSSGNSNTYSATNLANSDVVTDSPTNNFATWNPAIPTPYYVFSDGNLKLTVPNQWRNGIATMGVSTGKWYWEQIVSPSNLQYCNLGFVTEEGLWDNWLGSGTYIGYKPWSWGYDGSNGKIWHNAAGGTQLTVAPTTEWKAAVALDLDNGKAWFSLNGVWMGTGANPSTGAGAAFTGLADGSTYYPATTIYNLNSTANFGQNGTFSGLATAQGNEDTNGIGDFFYPVPSGFSALCTKNLPDPAIALPSAHFNTVVYTGNATARTIDVGMQPSFTWIKRRDGGGYHYLADAVRGFNTATNGSAKVLSSNDTAAEAASETQQLTSFVSNGFTLGTNSDNTFFVNNNTDTYVAWNWKANGSGSTNNDGATATVSANQAAGFSIVKYANPSGSDVAIGHGLGVKPELWIVKDLENVGSNFVYTTAIDGGGDYLKLNATDGSNAWGGTVPTTSLWYETFSGNTGEDFICYLFASKPGFSKIGVYTGNGNADGPMVNCGFRAAWVLIKRTDATNNWIMFDNKRDVDNVATQYLLANESQAEAALNPAVDFLSNGFKIRNTGNAMNANNGVYLYLAFAESPFKTSNAH